MMVFGRSTGKDDLSTEIHREIHSISTRLQTLENDVLKLQSQLKLALNEWTDLYDKTRRQVDRFRKYASDSAGQDGEQRVTYPEPMSVEAQREFLLRKARGQ